MINKITTVNRSLVARIVSQYVLFLSRTGTLVGEGGIQIQFLLYIQWNISITALRIKNTSDLLAI